MSDSTSEPVFHSSRLPPGAVELLRNLILLMFRIFTRLDVQGLENLPTDGGFIVSINHLSWLDAPLVYALVKKRKLTAFAADTYRHRPLFRIFVQCLDVIWVHRGAVTPSTLKHAIRALRPGVICVAPEGTRSKTQALIKGQPGAAFLAVTAGVPVLPVALNHTDRVLPALLRFKRQPVTVTVGQPVMFSRTPQHRPDSQTLQQNTDEIMCRIAALLPLERRGVYAEHPRLNEILREDLGTSTLKTSDCANLPALA